jgi:hypothetical protein
MPRSRRRTSAALFIALGLVATLIIALAPPRVTAQSATPVPLATPAATPVAGGVPCTNLFGIAIGHACVIVVNASPDAGPIDVYIDGVLTLPGLAFGSLGDFIHVVAGERRIQIVPSGLGTDAAVIDTRVDLADGVAYEIATVGALDAIAPRLLPIDTRPLAHEAARLRVVHASPDAPAIDLAIVGGNVVIENVAYPELAGYVELPSGLYDLEARVAGSTDLALPLPGILLAPNTVYTIYIIGQVNDGTLSFTLVPVLVSPDIAAAATPVA